MTIKPVSLYYWTAQALEAVLMRLTTDLHGCPACGAFPPAGHDEGCPVAAFNLAIQTAKVPVPSIEESRRNIAGAQRTLATMRRRSSGRGGARPGAGHKSNRGGARPGAGRKPAKAAARKRTPAKKRAPAKPARPRPSRAKKKSHKAVFVSTPQGTGTGAPVTPPA